MAEGQGLEIQNASDEVAEFNLRIVFLECLSGRQVSVAVGPRAAQISFIVRAAPAAPHPKTQLSAMGRRWASERDVQVGCDLTEELFEIYQRYLLLERAVSFRTAADYCERIRMFFMRAGLFDAASLQALSDITGTLVEEAADRLCQ